jgi:homoserine dehydrogenase
VELIGGVDVARELILSAIKNKKHVVTANKAVIFHHGDEIFKEAALNGVKVLFESSVCAGTPIIKLLFEELAANKITKIAGMLNGTSNFILSNMEEGADFKPTLELAQKEGYAEPDPAFDIEGMDAAHKIGILSSLAFGTPLPPEDFYIEGYIRNRKD